MSDHYSESPASIERRLLVCHAYLYRRDCGWTHMVEGGWVGAVAGLVVLLKVAQMASRMEVHMLSFMVSCMVSNLLAMLITLDRRAVISVWICVFLTSVVIIAISSCFISWRSWDRGA
jgi:hypothetical protein